MKANPTRARRAPGGHGAHFDAASRGGNELCLSQGAEPQHISFDNTIKKPADIRFAHHAGIMLFAAGAAEELEKIVEIAPGAEVYIRVLVENSQADWPLSRKFGCREAMAADLFGRAVDLGLTPVGMSFHVGSQARRAEMWAPVLDHVAGIWRDLVARDYAMSLLDIGGGFPVFYDDPVDTPTTCASRVMALVTGRFGAVAPGEGRTGARHGGGSRRDPRRCGAGIDDIRRRRAPLDLSRQRPVFGACRDRRRGDPRPDTPPARPRRGRPLHPRGSLLRPGRRAL